MDCRDFFPGQGETRQGRASGGLQGRAGQGRVGQGSDATGKGGVRGKDEAVSSCVAS